MRKNMKRSILLAIIYCIGIGGLTFFIGALAPIKNENGVAEAITNMDSLVSSVSDGTDLDNSSDSNIKMSQSALASTITSTPIPTPEATVTPAPTAVPTPLPVYQISVGGYPDIDEFFHDYYVAWNSCDYNLLDNVITNPDNYISLSSLQKETLFLDDIRDLTYYVMKSYEEDAYIVYVYYEMKYVNIKTTLPRLDKFYLITDKEGNLKINNSEMDEVLKTYFDDRDQDTIISGIIMDTNDKAKAALEKDEDLRLYVDALYRK